MDEPIQLWRRFAEPEPIPVRRTMDHADLCQQCRVFIPVYTTRHFRLCAECCEKAFRSIAR